MIGFEDHDKIILSPEQICEIQDSDQASRRPNHLIYNAYNACYLIIHIMCILSVCRGTLTTAGSRGLGAIAMLFGSLLLSSQIPVMRSSYDLKCYHNMFPILWFEKWSGGTISTFTDLQT